MKMAVMQRFGCELSLHLTKEDKEPTKNAVMPRFQYQLFTNLLEKGENANLITNDKPQQIKYQRCMFCPCLSEKWIVRKMD